MARTAARALGSRMTDAVHRLVNLWDLVRAPPEPTLPGTFRFGRPPVALRCVRVMGMVVQAGGDGRLVVDDGTGIVSVVHTPAPGAGVPAALGQLVDVLGDVVQDGGDRFVRAHALHVVDDPVREPLRFLEVMDVYRSEYFRMLQGVGNGGLRADDVERAIQQHDDGVTREALAAALGVGDESALVPMLAALSEGARVYQREGRYFAL